jgi:outer membrane protein assembly factor BamD
LRITKFLAFTLLAGALLTAACGLRRHAIDTPLISDSEQPDKELFDRAADFLEHNKFTEARLLLQTLINTYPDSEYLAKSKLAIADSWYRQGTTSDLAQAEAEYRDFITFFPTMPEAGEAQMRVAMIHYRGMEKADRDPTHARRAEQEFQRLLLNYPDGPFVPVAEQRLREVQEVLAQGIFEIGRFYFLNQADRAAQPRLKELVERYPNFSKADTALMFMGESILRQSGKEKGEEAAAEYFAKVVRDFPLSESAEEARKHLQELGAPIPEPDPAAVARMTYEQAHTDEPGMVDRFWDIFHRRPNVSAAMGKTNPPTMTPQGPAQAGSSSVPTAGDTLSGGSGSGAGNGLMMEQIPTPTQ